MQVLFQPNNDQDEKIHKKSKLKQIGPSKTTQITQNFNQNQQA